MLYKRQRIVKKTVIVYEQVSDLRHPTQVKGIIYNKKFIFKRIIGIIFSCSGCILDGKCDGIYIIDNAYKINRYCCRKQSSFYGIRIFYKCYSEEGIITYRRKDIYVP